MPNFHEDELAARRALTSAAPTFTGYQGQREAADALRRPAEASYAALHAEVDAAMENGLQPIVGMRKHFGVSQQELADGAGISRTYLSHIENGKAKNLTLTTARRIASALGAHVDECFTQDYGEGSSAA